MSNSNLSGNGKQQQQNAAAVRHGGPADVGVASPVDDQENAKSSPPTALEPWPGVEPPIFSHAPTAPKPGTAWNNHAVKAEGVLLHILRLPGLFSVAQQSLLPAHFRSVGRHDLADLWAAALEVVQQRGVQAVAVSGWRHFLEQAVRSRGHSIEGGQSLLGRNGQPGFLDKTFALPVASLAESSAQADLQQLMFDTQVAGPLRRILERARTGEAAPSVALERIQAVVKRAADLTSTGDKPLFLTPDEFAATDFKQNWLIPQVLVEGQPCIVGGPSKSLKTSIMVDLAVSIGVGAGRKFLDKFPVKQDGRRVGFISGESGGFTLQETFTRVCKSRHVKLADANVYPEFRLPKLGQSKEVQRLASQIRRLELAVILIDPVYLSLLAGNPQAKASSLFDMGPLLGDLSAACLEAGATPILIHHTVKHLATTVTGGLFEPIDREQLAMSGFAEFARQWLLINRRTRYEDGSGQHELWLRVGGSAGFGGLWGVDITEGVVQEDFTGRIWRVLVQEPETLKERLAQRQQVVKERQQQDKEQALKDKICAALQRFPGGETATVLREVAGIGKNTHVAQLLHELVLARRIQPVKVQKDSGRAKREYDGYQLTDPFRTLPDASGAPGEAAGISSPGTVPDAPGSATSTRTESMAAHATAPAELPKTSTSVVAPPVLGESTAA